ncbi:hypothetical protein BA899_00070 [Spiribacter sp. SSL99]|uniref:SapC family protein n=1 Tax=Spiribacter roseus TaxID=1855875 RepID=A0ABV3RVY5_9GAMM|nr:SapC family protein [Spiribacter sp. SSL99]KAF0285429.1 hypothetical protein BA899_00070 [Spiribacter sp. SSL99]
MADLLFYSEPVALNRDQHKSMKIDPPKDYGFTRQTNSVALAGVEFAEASRNFPIVFTRSAGQVIPVAVLGMRDEENLFVDSDGRWQADYIPAFVRRYPFVLANQPNEQDQFLVCVDGSAMSAETGNELFDADGQETEYLATATRFMREYHQRFQQTVEFAKKLDALGLLTERNARVTREDESAVVLGQFLSVDEQALMRLTTANVDELFRAGYMGWIYAHLISLGLFPALARRMGGVDAAA